MRGVLCTFGCTLYLRMYFALSLLKVQSTPEVTLTRKNQYFFYKKWKKGTQYIQKYIYVHSDVLCTFDCTLYFK